MPKKKIMTVPVRKTRESWGPEELAVHIKTLMSSSGWMIIKENLKRNVEVLEASILDKEMGGQVISDEDVEKLRYKRGFLMDLMATPENLIKHLDREGAQIDEFDPYHKDAEEMIRERRNAH